MFGRNESPNCLLWGMGSWGQLGGVAIWLCTGGGAGMGWAEVQGKVESGCKTTEQWWVRKSARGIGGFRRQMQGVGRAGGCQLDASGVCGKWTSFCKL